MSRPTEIIIDLDALRQNCRLAKSLSGRGKVVAVVKADAYGHGAADIALTIEPEVSMFAVSCMEEALALRKQGVSLPILLLEGCFSEDEYGLAATQNMQITVHNRQQVEQLQQANLSKPIKTWLKVDSGMHRLGVLPNEFLELYQALIGLPWVEDVVLMTHLASADDQAKDFTRMQLSRFKKAINSISDKVYPLSIANSAGLLRWEEARADWNRPGIMLYGISPFDFEQEQATKLKPVMSFSSKVIAVRQIEPGEAVGYGNTWVADKPSTIATVAVGYGDGYPRTAGSGTPVMVNGHRCSLAGRVSMDMICVDVTDLDDVNPGDDVELWGKNLEVNEVASHAGSIGYELVTRMPRRTKRRFIG